MSSSVSIPASVWKEVCDFFEPLVAPCKDCVWGNPVSCWRAQCAAHKYRPIAKDVLSVKTNGTQHVHDVPNYIKVENEILQSLANYDRPVSPSALKLWTTNSKSIKTKAISRLIRKGLVIEERVSDYVRYISLPQKKRNPKK